MMVPTRFTHTDEIRKAEARRRGIRVYFQSLAISFFLVLILALIASAPHCSPLWVLLLPGAFAAAVFFPQGIDSYAGNAYLVVAGVSTSC